MRSPPWAARSLHAGEWWWQTPRRRGEGSAIRPWCPCERKLGKLKVDTMWDAKICRAVARVSTSSTEWFHCGAWYEWPLVADMNTLWVSWLYFMCDCSRGYREYIATWFTCREMWSRIGAPFVMMAKDEFLVIIRCLLTSHFEVGETAGTRYIACYTGSVNGRYYTIDPMDSISTIL